MATSTRVTGNINLRATSIGGGMNSSISYDSNEQFAISEVVSVGTTDETLSFGDVETPRYVAIENLNTSGILLIGFDGTNYDMECKPSESMVLRLRGDDKVEKQTVTTVADSSDSLDGTWFVVNGNSGSWAVWIDTDDSGTAEPSHGEDDSVEVTGIVTDDTAASVAAAVYAALTSSTNFMLDFDVEYDATVDDDLITIIDVHTGNRTDIADGSTGTGFTLAKTQDGGTQRTVHAKGDSVAVQAKVSIIPN